MTENTLQRALIKLRSTQVAECHLTSSTNFGTATSKESSLKLEHRTRLVSENASAFVVEFLAEIENDIATLKIKLVFRALFESSVQVNEEFLKSHFVILNAPAIAFPFLRSFVTTISVNAGYPPIILPAINFAKSSEGKEIPPITP